MILQRCPDKNTISARSGYSIFIQMHLHYVSFTRTTCPES